MKNTNDHITIKKQDVVSYIYFVCSMAQRGKMYGGISGKSDYIGGVFDRWINIIPESVIFNKYFLPKIKDGLEVISDYYEYDPKKSGIAPDVLGIKVEGKAIPFVEYINKWKPLPNAPQIEVKSFKESQYMVSLRNQGYDSQFLVMVETNLDSDYLLPFFEEVVTSENVYNSLKMDDKVFIKKNENDDLSSVTKIFRTNTDLGSLRLITVCLASDFMQYSNLCKGGESPCYVKNINITRSTKTTPKTSPLKELLNEKSINLYCWKENILNNNQKCILIDVYVENIDKIQFVKNSKSSITITTTASAKINDIDLESNKTYIIKFQTLERTSSNIEHFMHKSIIDKIPSKENAMLENMKKFIE